jgi:excisionase family DNA binding protein
MKNSNIELSGNHAQFHERKLPVSVQNRAFEPLLDSTEAAQLLRIHPKTLQRMARKREVPAIQIGKLWRFSTSALLLWQQQKLTG